MLISTSSRGACVALSILVAAGCGRYGYESHGLDASVRSDAPILTDMDGSDLAVDAAMDALVDSGADMLPEEEPAFLVFPTTGLVTSETGSSATFSVRLATQPTATVSTLVASSDTTEVTVTPAFLSFTTENWASAQTVTVTGVDDAEQDGNQAFAITTTPATSADPEYAALDVPDVAGTNLDDETPGIVVVAAAGLHTTEAGGSVTFNVSLQSAPESDVTVPLATTDASEGAVSPSSVVFTPLNWNSPQVVTVTGEDDDVNDGDIAYAIEVGPSASSHVEYNDLSAGDVPLVNDDDESARLVLVTAPSLITTEGGGTATFTVALGSEPTASVTLALSSSAPTEGTVVPATLTFNSVDWAAPQTITVTGVDDAVEDGDQLYEIRLDVSSSGDADYAALPARTVPVTNIDDETAGITVAPTSGLVTSEAGTTATFTVVLNSMPSSDVVVGLSSDTPSEGTVSPASLTFTSTDWNMPQTVTVTGVDDVVADGSRAYTVLTTSAASADLDYNGFNPVDVAASNLDDDSPGVTVVAVPGLTTTEAGGSATFTVVLNVDPGMAVHIDFVSSDTTEGTVSPSMLTFDHLNWDMPQTITVTGVNDAVDDGDISYSVLTSVTSSPNPLYDGVPVADVNVTNLDDDAAGVTVTPTSGLVTTEAGANATFTVVLTSQPSGDVTINLASSNSGEGTASPANLLFTSANWSTPRTVTVTGVDDLVDDGDVAYSILTDASALDPAYSGVAVDDVSVTNTDNETASVTVTPTSGLVTTELGGTANFTVVLTSQPTADVVIGVSSSNVSEGSVSPASLTFTSANWSTPQTVTATGVNEALLDADVAYSIVTAAATSTDTVYSGLAVADVSATNWTVPTYLKASNTGAGDEFGTAVALSADRNTVVVGARFEDSSATGINGDGTSNAAADSGAVYVFVRSGATWVQQAYLKASNTDAGDYFGYAVAVSSDGNTLAVGAMLERSSATGIGGNQASNATYGAGAVYVFTRSGSTWTQQAYIKAADVAADDYFGESVALSADGSTLAVGAPHETGSGFGVEPAHARAAPWRGAAYVFSRSGTVWSQQAYIKDSVSSRYFGSKLAMSADGNTLAVNNLSAVFSTLQNGVTVYVRSGSTWSLQQRLIEPAWSLTNTAFGLTISISSDGNSLFVGCTESSMATGLLYTRSGAMWTLGPSFTKTISGSGYGSQGVISGDASALLFGAINEDSAARRLNGDETSSASDDSGASWLLRDSAGTWSQAFYVKSHEPGAMDWFGGESSLGGVRSALSSTGSTVVVSAIHEDSNATGVNGDATNNSAADSGAVYIYE